MPEAQNKMTIEITKIDPPKQSSDGRHAYRRVYFKEIGSGKFLMTDLVMGFRNYARWKNLLKAGNFIGGVYEKAPGRIDADSVPYLANPRNEESEIEQLAKMGVF
jgi:hypothetical protein